MKEVLVMRLSAMGDVAMTLPVLCSFLEANPDVHVTFLSAPRLEPIFSNIPHLTFFPVDTKKTYAGNLGMFRLFRDLRKTTHFDQMIDLHDVLRSKILRTLYKIFRTPVSVIDKGRAEKKKLTRREDKQKIQLKTSVQRYIETFQRAGFSVNPLRKDFFPIQNFSETESIKEILSANSQRNKVGVAPFAQHNGKIYPIEKCEEIVAHYAQSTNTQLFLFGGGQREKAILDGWAKKYSNTTSLVGRFNLTEELTLIRHCDVLLSMDSANMHLASLVGTPVVSVWGATHPYAGFYGFGQDEKDAVQIDLPCRPCSIFGNKPCYLGDFRCMTQISPAQIIAKIDAHLTKK